MTIGDFVSVSVSVAAAPNFSQTAMGIGTIAGYHTHYPDRLRYYTSTAGMVTDGFVTTEPLYRQATVYFSQSPAPPRLGIGRRALPNTQILVLTLSDTVSGDLYTFNIVGFDGVSHAVSMVSTGVPNTDATSLAALLTFTNIGTVSHLTNTVTLTQAAASGHLVDINTWSSNIGLQDTTTDPGIATDLAAILAVDTVGWYGLALDSNSKAEVVAAAAWVEGTGQGGKTGWWNNSDLVDIQATSTDVFSALQTSTYKRSFAQFSGKGVLSWGGTSAMAYALAQNPGSYTLAYKTEPGVTADTDTSLTETQALILNTMSTASPGTGGKNGNYYKVQSGVPILWPGVTPSGQFMDLSIFTDWLQINVQAAVAKALASVPKLPYTDPGISAIKYAILSILKLGATPAYNAIDPTSIVVTVPTAASVTAASRANRDLPNVTFSCRYTGAIQTTEIIGTVFL